jgi:hypothetical protein
MFIAVRNIRYVWRLNRRRAGETCSALRRRTRTVDIGPRFASAASASQGCAEEVFDQPDRHHLGSMLLLPPEGSVWRISSGQCRVTPWPGAAAPDRAWPGANHSWCTRDQPPGHRAGVNGRSWASLGLTGFSLAAFDRANRRRLLGDTSQPETWNGSLVRQEGRTVGVWVEPTSLPTLLQHIR